METPPTAANTNVSESAVREYLAHYPDFLKNNPDVLLGLNFPEREMGNTVTDFQQHLVKRLRENSDVMQQKYNLLVDFCRDNLSVQTQVHQAVLRLVRAQNLEQLLEAVTLDLMSLFNVDVVRLAVESDAPELYETYYSEENYSGIVFVESGVANASIGINKKARLVSNINQVPVDGFEQIFVDCSSLIESCALLRLELHQLQKQVILAFGVRHVGRFHPGQGTELLLFLAQIVAHQLDRYWGNEA